jgi:hypothetical protein
MMLLVWDDILQFSNRCLVWTPLPLHRRYRLVNKSCSEQDLFCEGFASETNAESNTLLVWLQVEVAYRLTVRGVRY